MARESRCQFSGVKSTGVLTFLMTGVVLPASFDIALIAVSRLFYYLGFFINLVNQGQGSGT